MGSNWISSPCTHGLELSPGCKLAQSKGTPNLFPVPFITLCQCLENHFLKICIFLSFLVVSVRRVNLVFVTLACLGLEAIQRMDWKFL